jgi:hypothetical protein
MCLCVGFDSSLADERRVSALAMQASNIGRIFSSLDVRAVPLPLKPSTSVPVLSPNE